MRRSMRAIFGGLMLVTALACASLTPGSIPQAGVSTIVAETLSAATIAAPPPVDTPTVPYGISSAFPGGSMVIPTGLGTGAAAETVAAALNVEGAPWWGIAPEHVRLTLESYPLQGKFHEPEILIFPAAEYAAVNESVAGNIQQLQGVASNPGSVPDDNSLPHISFFNAGPVFQAQVAVVPFQGGYGVRALTEYAQYTAPINNNDMFYHFQGLTSDGKKYIVAILPVTAPLLQADSAQASVPPAGGVTFPDFAAPDPAVFQIYYDAVSSLLSSTPAGDFTPSLTSLDALIGSLSVTP
jgi:hypothetical protein